MAANSFGLFIQQLNAADDELKVKVVQIVFDLLMVQDINTLVSKTMPVDKVNDLVRHTLAQDDPVVQAFACEGVCKLMLAGMIDDPTVSRVFPSHDLTIRVLMTDSAVARLAILLARDFRQPSTEAMPDILPPCLLLFVARQPATDDDGEHCRSLGSMQY